MNRGILSVFALAIVLASCSSAYRQAQTPDDVYYSPGKEKERTYASANDNRRTENYSRRNNSDYEDYTSSTDDQYLRMKIQNRYRWNSLDDYDYWYSPGYAFNNYYGYNSFNPLLSNSWGLNYYYSPFASIQPFGWFNSYYPTYGYYTPYNGYFGHNYGYGYSPVFMTNTRRTPGVHRPLLGGYANNSYLNNNNRSRTNGRYIPGFNSEGSRYNNRNTNNFNNRNNNSFNNNSNRSTNYNNSNSAPVRSFTPSSSGSSGGGSSSGGGVSRPPRR